eukprot:6041505-Pyramimonas_sp.AAC.1
MLEGGSVETSEEEHKFGFEKPTKVVDPAGGQASGQSPETAPAGAVKRKDVGGGESGEGEANQKKQ